MMPEGIKIEDFKSQVDKILKAFRTEWERFKDFLRDPSAPEFIEALKTHWENDAPLLQKANSALDDLKKLQTQFLGRKSELASLKRMLGQLDEAHRGVAGQTIQFAENQIRGEQALYKVENNLRQFKDKLLIEREIIDVTL